MVVVTMVLFRCASAQEAPDAPPRIQVGPLRLTPKITLQDFGYDSNILNQAVNPKSDFTFTFIPSLVVATGFRRATFTFTTNTGFVYYATHRSERSVDRDYGATAVVPFRRIRLFAQASYVNARQRFNYEIDVRARRAEFYGEAGIRVSISPRISADLSHRRLDVEFDPDAFFDNTRLAERLNRESRSVFAAFRYVATPLTSVIASVESGGTTFRLAPFRDSDAWRASIGVETQPRALIAGAATVGFQRLLPRNPVVPEFSGPVGTVGVSYRSPWATLLALSLERRLVDSYSREEPYYVADGFRIGVRRQLADRADLEVATRRYWHHYRRLTDDLFAGTIQGRTERISEDGATFGYRVSPSTRARVGISYWRRRSDQRDYRNYDGLRIGTTISYGF